VSVNDRDKIIAEIKRLDMIAEIQALESVKKKPQAEKLSMAEMIKRSPQDAVQSLKNYPGSMVQAGKNAYNALSHPQQTAEAVGGLFKSLAAKVGKGYGFPQPEGAEDAANAAGQALKNRYGGLNEIRNTVINDPFGVQMDIASVGMPLGGMPGRVLAAVDPVNIALNAAKAPLKPLIPKKLPEALYKHALKLNFPEELSDTDISASLQAGMQKRITGDEAGRSKLKESIKPLKPKVEEAIDQATAAGEMVRADALWEFFNDLRADASGVKVKGPERLAKIDAIEADLRAQVGNRWELTPREMQDFKTDAYEEIYKAGKKGKTRQAEIISESARGAKTELERVVPEVAGVNEELHRLMTLNRPLKKAVRANPGHYGNLLRGTAPAVAGTLAHMALGPVYGLPAAVATYLATKPGSKAKLAMALNRIQKGDLGWLDNNLTAAETRAVLSIAGREEETEEKE